MPSRRPTVAAASAAAFLSVAVTAGAAAMIASPDAPVGPRALAIAAGTLSIADSRDGRAILTAGDIAPGDTVEGSLTIRNTGTLPGVLALRSGGVGADGPRDGALLDALRLEVSDVTDGATRVHDGGLDDVDEPDLGRVAPGAARTFRFVARLPETPGADNRLQDASVQLGFRWTLTAADGEVPDPPATTTEPQTTTPGTTTEPETTPAPPSPDGPPPVLPPAAPSPAPGPGPGPGPGDPPSPAPKPTTGPAPVVRLITRSVRVDRLARFGVRVSCARGARGCRVRVLVRRGKRTINTRTLTLAPGRSIVVRTRATPEMRRQLRRGRRVVVRVAFRASGGARVPHSTRVVVRPAPRPASPLRPPR